jgi:hypothetical protein
MKLKNNLMLKTLLMIIFSHLIISMSLKTTLKESLSLKATTAAAKVTFKDPDHKITPCDCDPKKNPKTITPNTSFAKTISPSETENHLPRNNPFRELRMGEDASAYFFDFLDGLLRKKLVDEFKRVYEEAKKIDRKDPNYQDPYPLAKITKTESVDPKPDEATQKKVLKSIMEKEKIQYDENNYDSYITAVQVNTLLTKWNWDPIPGSKDPAKQFIDTYDYNGDGRLDPSEFTMAMILHNKRSTLYEKNCEFCLRKEVIDEFLDPIFTYADCQKDGFITAEYIWKALKHLKREENNDKWDMYKCLINGQPLRTNSVNEFVLKSKLIKSGRMTKEEFITAVLLGYWNRQTGTKGEEIYTDAQKSLSSLRWKNDVVDDACEDIKKTQTS